MQQHYVVNDCFKVLFVLNHSAVSRLGVSVGKKLLPAAVKRNRVKRIVREAFRQQNIRQLGLDVVVLARRGCLSETRKACADKLKQLFVLVENKCAEL
ncbi:MAG: ribonuclease P protein component [Pseudomonadota bacterium]